MLVSVCIMLFTQLEAKKKNEQATFFLFPYELVTESPKIQNRRIKMSNGDT